MKESNLGSISKIMKTGKTPPSKNEAYFLPDFNWYTPGDVVNSKYLITSERYVSQLAVDENKATIYLENSILITCIGNIGRVGISKNQCASNQQITAIKPIDEVNVEYLYYWFIAHQKLISDKANNAVVPIMNNRTLKEIKFSYPPLETQKRIAQILDDAAALRDKTAQLLNEYDLLSQSIFLDMFGDPVVNPKGWEVDALKNYGEFKNGMNFSKSETGFKMKCLGVGDFKSLYRIDESDWLSNIHLNKAPSQDYLLENGDIIFVRSNGNKKLVGRAIVIYPRKKEVTFSGFCIRLRINNESLNPIFMVQLLRIESFKARMLQNGRGANIQNINQQILGSLKVIVPPIRVQNLFEQKLTLIEEQKTLAKQELKEAEDLFNCLLQKAFKGELV